MKTRVLVVEDNRYMLDYFEKMFERDDRFV